MTPDEFAAHVRVLKDVDLEFIVSTEAPATAEAVAANVELRRRKRRRTFWLRIVWILLVLSVITIVIAIYAGTP